MNRRSLIVLLASTILYSLSVSSYAAKPVYSGGPHRAAVRGYDVVAYFTESKPVRGSLDHSVEHLGATWLFSSQKNKDSFVQKPGKYMPQYGGYCAYAVAKNSSASSKPEYFTIYDGKLYMNFSKSVNKKWVKDKPGYISSADKNWEKRQQKTKAK